MAANYGLLQPIERVKPADILGAAKEATNTSYLQQLTAASKGQEARAIEEAPLNKALAEEKLKAMKLGNAFDQEKNPLVLQQMQQEMANRNEQVAFAKADNIYKQSMRVAEMLGAVKFAPEDQKASVYQQQREKAEKLGLPLDGYPQVYDKDAANAVNTGLVSAMGAANLALEQMKQVSAVNVAKVKAQASTGAAPKGYKWKDGDPTTGTLEPIPGGPAAKMTPQNAAAKANLEASLPGWEQAKEILLPGGKVNRAAIWTGTGASVPILGGGSIPFTQGQKAYQEARRVLYSKLRLESGAAVPDTELERYVDLYMPKKTDSDDAIKGKLSNLDAFIKGTGSNIKGISDAAYAKEKATATNPKAFSVLDNYEASIGGKPTAIKGSDIQAAVKATLPEGKEPTEADIKAFLDRKGLKKKVTRN